ncbi:TonB-linked outer membrane protein, SusC/RagA family [Mucilaginibacter gossypiicola]|uniref:TonB-linked outer membrane protein, SusC/RagA family n=1 Tax=Mucilaginibacter gossypiicola TaxID=551995 RepID=A0A1H8HRD8_9SPHI|nr:TonB-dependent receptor [Mucilaginibacter gossypiicola]SEN58634.1 TonB-linked outer membrane protein, SusC/RagA family [Mucilaginibacter gossypiicola]
MKKTRRVFPLRGAPVCLKVILLMKAVFLFVLATCVQVSAKVYSQQKFTLSLKQAEVSSILTKIQKQSDYRFFYNYASIKKLGKVDLDVKDATIDELLAAIIDDKLSYKMNDDHVVIIANQEETKSIALVKGKVVDAKGEPLIGVNIRLQGTNQGTTTDANGNFSIDAPINGVLEISYIGFEKKIVTITGSQTLNITLVALPSALTEVVVVGYGTTKKIDVTGSVASVKGTDIQNLPVASATQALDGRAAGVNIVRNDGSPGAASSIRIRGTGTLNDANPLIVVDGVPTSDPDALSDINPNDIASVDILKDASAAAIYGTRAANGVVLVTTKRGTYNQKLATTVNFYNGFSNTTKYLKLLTAPDLYSLKRERYTNDGVAIDAPWNDSYYATQRTDWQRAIMKTGHVINGDVNLQGGNDVSNYYWSTSVYNDDGIIDKTNFKRFSTRFNSEHKVTEWLKLGENIQLSYANNVGFDNNNSQTGLIFSALRFNPAIPLVNPDGTYGTSKAFANQLGDINSPYATIQEADRFNKKYRALANAFAEISFLKELKLRVNYAYDGTLNRVYNFSIADVNQARQNTTSQLTQNEGETSSQLLESFLTYDKVFGKSHVTFTGGYSYQNYKTYGFSAWRIGYDDTSVDQRVLGTGNSQFNNSVIPDQWSLQSAFGRMFYDYDGRFLATLTFRADGSSRFAPSKRWGYFPAFSLGWRLSNEQFIKNISWISNLKLSGGYGELGNQNITTFQYASLIKLGSTYENNGYTFGGVGYTGAAVSQLANLDIAWERTAMTNVSLDAGFLNNQLTTTLAWFNKNTKDMLLAPPVVGSAGSVGIPLQNIGTMNNHGVEVEVNYHGGNKVKYSVGANASFIKNKVTKLNGEGTFVGATVYGRSSQEISRTYQGQPIASFYGWKTNGLYQTQADIDNDPALKNDSRKSSIRPGDVRFLDLNGDGLIDGNDRTNLGNPNPNVTAGLQGSVSYKGFDFSANFTGVFGVSLYNADRMQGIDPTYPFNLYAETLGRWTGPGTSNTIPRLSLDRANDNYRTSDLFVESGSYVSLKNATLGYTLPVSWAKKATLKSVRLYASGQNLFFITGYKGYTPELGYTNGNLQRGVDVAQYPSVRIITFGVTVKL